MMLAVSAAWTYAGQSDTPDALNTRVRNATIVGNVTGPVAGVCSMSGYAAICPSGPSNCSCITISNARVRGSLAGNGSADVNLTLDSGSATSSISGSTCLPAFGTADLTTVQGAGRNLTIRSETLNLVGAFCDRFSGRPAQINGGFGIASSPAPSPDASGWGTLAGTQRGSQMTIKLQGSITQ